MFDAFEREDQQKYEEEVRRKYDPCLVAQSKDRTTGFTEDDWESIRMESDRICRGLVAHMEEEPEHPDVLSLVEAYHGIMNCFYDCSLEIFRGLGGMYVQDERFKANYDAYHPRLAEFLRDAIYAYCDANTTDVE